ncbi:MAG: cobyrinate a,c-diamide synthase [Mycobacterium sp.]
MLSRCPAIVVAAPASNSGKTVVATGLMGALRNSGHRVAPFKVGPDFIDPGYHAIATDMPGRNLDPVLVGDDLIGPLYLHGSRGADIAVVEGVMGLFDGRIDEQIVTPARGSTAQVAKLLGAPVLLVVDARSQSQSVGALVQGFATFDHGVRLGGVILNRVGSTRHERVLRQACEAVGVPVLGALPRFDELMVPSRHLGLVTATEHGRRAIDAVEAMATLIGRHVDLAAVVEMADCGIRDQPWSPEVVGESVGNRPVVAVAAGAAFTFGYAEHYELLRAAGAQAVEFDPLADVLPERTAAVVLPGGFPEQHLPQLSGNATLIEQIRALPPSIPIHAECGGLVYLMGELDGHPLCGAIAGSARFTERLTIGYRDAAAVSDSALYAAGERVVGHEFHRTEVEFSGGREAAWAFRRDGGPPVRDGVIRGGIHASYLHTHPAARPDAIARFVARAASAAAAPFRLGR